MITTLITRSGTVNFDTENCRFIYFENNPVRNAVENYFEDWINEQPNDTQEKYTLPLEELNGQTFFNYSGAVTGGIENLISYIEENNIKSATTQIFFKADIVAAFEN